MAKKEKFSSKSEPFITNKPNHYAGQRISFNVKIKPGLEEELQIFRRNLKQWIKDGHNGHIVFIKGKKIYGFSYNDKKMVRKKWAEIGEMIPCFLVVRDSILIKTDAKETENV